MNYQENEYFYIYDLQGNVIGLMNENGVIVVEYEYDAWGNEVHFENNAILNFDLASINPYRYRGYRYDEDTGYYYLQSRYYNPEFGRFLNMDDASFLSSDTSTGINLYAYCANNPVMYSDISGNFAFLLLGIVITMTCTQILELAAIAVAVTALIWWIDSGSEKTINFINDTILKSDENDTNLPSLPEGWDFDDPTKSPGEEWEWRGSTDEPVPDEYGKYHGNWVNKDTQDWLHPDLNHPLPEVPHWDYGKHNGPSWRVDRNGNMTPKIAIPKIPY